MPINAEEFITELAIAATEYDEDDYVYFSAIEQKEIAYSKLNQAELIAEAEKFAPYLLRLL